MAAPKKYFNLYFETPNKDYSEQEIFNTFGYPVLDENEINQYIDLLKRKSWGEHTIGKYTLQVTPPTKIKIFDLSKVGNKGDVYSRDELLKMVPLNLDDDITLFEQFERYGADVTKEMFEDEIDFLLSQLQIEIQVEQRGINAETGESGSFFTEENIKGQVKSGSSVEGKLEDKASPIFPNPFSNGIIDNSIEPAFKVEKIALVFANHLKNLKHENGQMIGVFGQWGRGKSYFLKNVFDILHSEKRQQFIQVNFQAWRYQNTPSIWAYLYETFIEEYLKVSWYEKLYRVFKLNERRNGKWKSWILPLFTIVFGIIWILVFNINDKLQGLNFLIKWSGGLASFLIIVFKLSYFGYFSKDPAIKIFNTISKVPSFKGILGVQAEIQKELVYLIQAWTEINKDKRILLFFDDLDRCSEHQLMNIIDSLRVMLDDEKINKHLLILVALDELKLTAAINEKYKKLTDEEQKPEFASEYLDKLFISAIKLFPISFDERAEFVKKLAKQINLEVSQEKGGTTVLEPTPTPETDSKAESGKSTDINQGTNPAPTPEPEIQKSSKNLEDVEVTMLQEKIQLANKDLTPRQIRILIYRYLLARNLWLTFYDVIDWKAGDAIDEIMRFSGFSKEDPKADTKVFGGLSKIVRMVVAY